VRALVLIAAPPNSDEGSALFLGSCGELATGAEMANKVHENGWYIWSSHGVVLFHIATHPSCTVAEIADELCLTQRTIWGAIGDLRQADMLEVERRGRRHYYRVNMAASFRAPAIKRVTLGTLFGALAGHRTNGSATTANGAAKV
jgi:hypothetical protein